MTAKELLDRGELDPAIAQLGAELKAKPGDRHARTALFELLCLAGAWDRAERQLDAIGHQGDDTEARLGVEFYRGLLRAERARERLFDAGERPRFAHDPTEEVSRHLEAL